MALVRCASTQMVTVDGKLEEITTYFYIRGEHVSSVEPNQNKQFNLDRCKVHLNNGQQFVVDGTSEELVRLFNS